MTAGRGAIRLIATDLDGTLLKSDKTIHEEDAAALFEARDRGASILLCSGRSREGMIPYLGALELEREGTLAVGLNGGIVFDAASKKVLETASHAAEDVSALIDIAGELRAVTYLQLYTGEKAFCCESGESSRYYEKLTGTTPLYAEALLQAGREEPVVEAGFFVRIEGGSPVCSADEVGNRLRELLPPHLFAVQSTPFLFEVIAPAANKGEGLKKAAKRLGIDTEEVLAMGDMENDLPLLQASGYRAAVANAEESLKKAAHYIAARTHNEGAVAEIIRHFL